MILSGRLEIMKMSFVSGFSAYTLLVRDSWEALFLEQLSKDTPELPEAKKFKAKHDLPLLQDYSKPAPDWFWEKFPSNLKDGKSSLINADVLYDLAIECGYKDHENLEKICGWLKNGAVIGCKSPFRDPVSASNAKSAITEGQKVTDSICDWIKKGFVYGPVDQQLVPNNAKFSGLMTRPKPNGAVRIILNLSAPSGSSVNDGIDNDEYPAFMSSTTDWLRVLNKVGLRCYISKTDFSDAYKHISVAKDDTDLQWFRWLGKAFKELCLIFGAVSSAGIFDAVAKIILFIVIKKANFFPDQCIQHLDDICAAASENSNLLHKFDDKFFEIAALLGVKLAPRDDPTKSFGPCTKGVVLGVEYDTVAWTWGLPAEKLVRLQKCLLDAFDSEFVLQRDMWSIAGKIINVKPLIPGGKFHVDHIIRAMGHSTVGTDKVYITPCLRKQLCFWYHILPVCSGRVAIPDPDRCLPPWTFNVYTDAAGGSSQNNWHGVGAVTSFWWSYIPWSKAINLGRDAGNGRRLNRVMSALELVGPLLVVAAGYRWCRNSCVRVWVDNSASVCIFNKGYSSSCRLSSTIVKAISTVAAGINCRIEIQKITRCSNEYAVMADFLSKGQFLKFYQLAKAQKANIPVDMAIVPKAVKVWLSNPCEDDLLGHKILLELADHTDVLSYNC